MCYSREKPREKEKEDRMRFQDKVVVITGGASGIGKTIRDRFEAEGAKTAIIDIRPNDYFQGSVSDQRLLEQFAAKVIRDYGKVDILVNNAKPVMQGIDECSYEAFSHALAVGVSGPFYLTRLFMPVFSDQASVINITSTRQDQSMPQTESYAAAKGALAALTHAMAVSLAPKVRVNAIAPGWISADGTVYAGADAAQQPLGRVGTPDDIADLALFLASPQAGFITGQNIAVDGGMSRLMIYHNEHGWTYQVPDGSGKKQ